MTGILDKRLNISTIHEANVLLTKMCLSCINMKMQWAVVELFTITNVYLALKRRKMKKKKEQVGNIAVK